MRTGARAVDISTRLKLYPSQNSHYDDTDRISASYFISRCQLIANHYGPTALLEMGQRVMLSDYGALGGLLNHCDTLQESIWMAFSYQDALYPGLKGKLTRCHDSMVCEMQSCNGEPEHLQHFYELQTSAFIRICNMLCGDTRSDIITRIEFPFPAQGMEQRYRDILKCELVFDCPQLRWHINPAALNYPVIGHNEEARAVFLKQVQQEYGLSVQESTLQHRVRRFVETHLFTGIPRLNESAEALGMSTSTLKRALKAEHTTYQKICDEIRLEQAKQLLANPGYRIDEISNMVGFSYRSVFEKFFLRTMNQSPVQYRKALG